MFADILSQATKLDARIGRSQFVRVLESHGLQRDDERLADIMAWLESDERPLRESDIQYLRQKSDLVERAFNGNLIVGRSNVWGAVLQGHASAQASERAREREFSAPVCITLSLPSLSNPLRPPRSPTSSTLPRS